MDALKYIVTDHGAFAIFNGLQNHSDVARSLYGKPVGAGFIRIMGDEGTSRASVHCYGRSVSLNLDSRGEIDQDIIHKNIGGIR